jgi:stearoyl-CoA desaturase (delta-9 desaturase)
MSNRLIAVLVLRLTVWAVQMLWIRWWAAGVSTLRRTGANERYQRMVAARDWLFLERTRQEVQSEKLPLFVRDNLLLRSYVELERDLYALWACSNAPRDDLFIHLQAWCLRAEKSGVESLREFGKRLRGYA